MGSSDAGTERERESNRVRPAPAGESGPVLASTLVTYRDRPDRRTVYPPGTSSVARMSTWLTADAGAFRDLEAMR